VVRNLVPKEEKGKSYVSIEKTAVLDPDDAAVRPVCRVGSCTILGR
jgi:hypothetical protein